MHNIKTHIAFHDGSTQQANSGLHNGFELSQVRHKSFNFKVENHAISLIAWGLKDDDTVTVHRARVGNVGNVSWTVSNCGLPISPDLNVNVAHMPYSRCGKRVVLTAGNPHCVIDDVGVFFLVYSGSSDTVVETLPDTIARKCSCKD